MKVLLVSNQHLNAHHVGNPIMMRMCESLKQDERVEQVNFLPFYNKIKSMIQIRRIGRLYDIVHVHFGGVYAILVRLVLCGLHCRMFISFHGTDIHAKAVNSTQSFWGRIKIRLNQKASFMCIRLYDKCGFVSQELLTYVPPRLKQHFSKKFFNQPLGVDYNVFIPMDKIVAQDYLGLIHRHYALFSDVSCTPIKRRDIASAIIGECHGQYELLIMSGVSPDLVPYYINACDFLLLTSDEEGSPNIIRESLSLNKPVFCVNVGDAAKQLEGLSNSSIISRDPVEASSVILQKMKEEYIDKTRENLRNRLDFRALNNLVVTQYEIDIKDNRSRGNMIV